MIQLCVEKNHTNHSTESEKIKMRDSCLCRCHGIEMGVVGYDNENQDESSSLDSQSDPASDISWQQDMCADMTLWIPDHVVTHCAGCDGRLWFGSPKNHCRLLFCEVRGVGDYTF